MKLKTVVGLILTFSVMIYAMITLFGSVHPYVAGMVFFGITFIGLILALLPHRAALKDHIGTVTFELFTLCAAISFLVMSVAIYTQNVQEERDLLIAVDEEIAYLSEYTEYQKTYATYLQKELTNYQSQNVQIESAIEDKQIQSPTPEPFQDIEEITIEDLIAYYLYDDDEYEYEYEDDDD